MYAILCNYASTKNRCWPSHATLALDLSCSVSSVKNYLGELVQAKLIVVRREQYRSCVYYMLSPEDLRDKKTQSSPQSPSPQQPKPDCIQPEAAHAQPKVGYLNTLKKQREEKNPPLPPRKPETPKGSPVSRTPSAGGVSSFASDFEIAWALYPKKESKGYAWIAWCKLARSGQLPSLDVVLASIRRFSVLESWQRDNGRYVPQMSHWLRGQRWLDPLSPAEEKEAKERQHREEQNRALLEQRERENNLQKQRDREKTLLRPMFDAFAAKFAEPLNERVEAMAFGTWMYLRSKHLAPLASDVPANNVLGIVDFMNAFKRQREEAEYRASHGQPEPNRRDSSVNEPRSCAEILRDFPVFSQVFSRTEQLRQAV